jgi:hypothetical protein
MKEFQIGDNVLVVVNGSKLVGSIVEINYVRYSINWLILKQEKNTTWIKMSDISLISVKDAEKESVQENVSREEETKKESTDDEWKYNPGDHNPELTPYQEFLDKLNLEDLRRKKYAAEKYIIKDTLYKKELREPNDYYQNPSFLSGTKNSSGE